MNEGEAKIDNKLNNVKKVTKRQFRKVVETLESNADKA